MAMKEQTGYRTVQTVGRSWDGGLQVFNHPVPRWWLGVLAAAALAALVYWLLYPSWSLPGGRHAGLARIELGEGDDRIEVAWSSGAELRRHQDNDDVRIQRRRLAWDMARTDYRSLIGDRRLLAFALASARAPYLDNCAACHAADGRGVAGLGPTLIKRDATDAGFAEIERIIRSDHHGGRGGVSAGLPASIEASVEAGRTAASDGMPPGTHGWSDLELKALTVYVRQLGQSGAAD